MSTAILEHVNFTVKNSESTAERLCDLFGWTVRWAGPSIHGGHSVHVGHKGQYLAVYSEAGEGPQVRENYKQTNALNHIGIVVDDLDAAESRILAAGYKTESHADYEPGRRFYFRDEDDVEYEVISYAKPRKNTISALLAAMGPWAEYASMMK